MLGSEIIDDRHARLRRWLGAATVIVAMHFGGGTLALMQWPEEESEPDPAGAVIMELAALAVVPPEQDLAFGPQVEDATPTPIPSEQAILEELDLPTVEEARLAPDPELVLPKIEPMETLEEPEEQELLQTQQHVTEVNTASSVATAPPKIDAAPSETIKAQTVGAVAQPSQAAITWQRALLLHLNRYKRYPAEARSRNVQGVTRVEFKIAASGHLVEAEIVKGSGSTLLDEEALAVLRRASPFPAPPDGSATGHIHLVLPIEFSIR
ncbi:MAG TPA: energy transducer TonB [Methyloceanibacter sp.]|nr:energy transducer TonB [Methyloceanibacter sp.]